MTRFGARRRRLAGRAVGWIFALAALAALAAPALSRSLVLSLEPLSLDEEDRERTRIGRLVWRGGFVLRSSDARFGGLSGLAVSPDGAMLSMVSDSGRWYRIGARYDAAGNLRSLDRAEFGRLRASPGRTLRDTKERDAESLEPVPGGFAVSFEQRHRIWIYRGAPNPFVSVPREILFPPLLNRGHPNQGIETLGRLRDGRLVAIAEGFPLGTADLFGWVRQDDRPATPWQAFRYRRNLLFKPTGATTLPDGNLLLVERRFTWVGGFAARLAILKTSEIRPGAVLAATPLAEFDSPPMAENFEGVAAWRDGKGRTMIYMVSDDNFHFMQRTLLVMFELVD